MLPRHGLEVVSGIILGLDTDTPDTGARVIDFIERSRIPLYLAAVHWGELAPILDYERWEDVQHSQTDPAPGLTRVEVRHDLPLVFPFHRAFYAGDEVRQQSSQTMDSHYPLYLQ